MQTRNNGSTAKMIHQLFEKQARETPDDIALIFKDQQLSYRELDERSNRLAHRILLHEVRPEALIGISMERSPELIISMLGVWKAGCAYVPLDPSYPQERLAFMMEDANLDLVLTQESCMDMLQDIHPENIRLQLWETAWPSEPAPNRKETAPIVDSVGLAYVIYTSGSTGRPKGVLLEHAGLCNLVEAQKVRFELSPASRVLQFASINFDTSLWEILLALCSGAALVMAPSEALMPGEDLADTINRFGITHFTAPPSVLALLDPAQFPSLEVVVSGGEALKLETARKWAARKKLYNAYGPTEATIEVSIARIEPNNDKITIGYPLENTTLYVLNQQGENLPAGEAGELHIAGAGLARGYLNRPELTAEKFIANPFQEGTQMYKTGDLARFLPDGQIEFLGRIDHQVKIRGYRIECGEIENVLMAIPGMKDVTVIDRTTVDGHAYLCAYYAGLEDIPTDRLRNHLLQKLPDYMVPARFVRLDALPLTPNGKVDRKALPEPEAVIHTGTSFTPPSSGLEQKLAAIWGNLLGLDASRISIHDNFFLLGGDSIRGAQLANRASQAGRAPITVKDIFARPTISQLAALLAERSGAALEEIPPAEPQKSYPLASAQKRVYLHSQMQGPESALYNLPAVYELSGKVEHARLAAAFQQVVDRFEVFRTAFELREGQLVQCISDQLAVEIPFERLGEDRLAIVLDTWGQEPFKLENAPLIHLKLVETPAGNQYLLLDSHHIIMDGLSYEPFFTALARAYDGQALEGPAMQYKDYAVWQQSETQQEIQAGHSAYWKDMYPSGLPMLELPFDFPLPATRTFAGETLRFELSKDTVAAMRQYSRQMNATPFMIGFSAFATLISKCARQEDIVIGTASSGRSHAQLEDLIGMFVNTLAIRAQVDQQQNFGELIQGIKELLLESFSHDAYPYDELVQALKKSGQAAPRLQLMFSMLPEDDFPALGGHTLRHRKTAGGQLAKFDLSFSGTEGPGGISFEVEYSTELFRRETIEKLFARFEQILAQALNNPEIGLQDIDIVLDEEHRLLEQWNATTAPYPWEKTIHELFEEQALRNPDHIALLFEDIALSYRELNAKANQLARYLAGAGVRQETLVGICMDRSPEMIISIFATWKAGGAYVPLDPAYPADRLAFMIEDARIHTLLTDENGRQIAAQACAGQPANIITLPAIQQELDQAPATPLPSISGPENLAYIIYTSGSTGRPKGVLIEHRNACNLAFAQRQLFEVDTSSKVLQFASLSFDASVWEILMALCNGAALVLAGKKDLLPGQGLADTFNRYKVTHCTLSPTALGQLEPQQVPHLQTIISAGEALPLSLAQKWANTKRMVNAYGPTEATVGSMSSCFSAGDKQVTIGRPLSNYQIFILDEKLKPLPPGLAGEIHIAGAGLARGYLNRPELTAGKFIAHPFQPSARIYKTGDLGRWLPNGQIEFLGRIDHQVKIRGFRIECGEIESALLSMDGIQEAAVVDKTDQNGHKYLCAYFVAKEETTIQELKAHLAGSLPEHMIPSRFMRLKALPLAPSGKVDRKAMPEPDGIVLTGIQYVAPATETEKMLSVLWSEILCLDRSHIGTHDNFFLLGGDSIRSVQLAGRISKECNKAVSVKDIFERPTISGQAELIASRKDAALADIPPAAPQEYYPLSSAQKRVFLHSQLQGTNSTLYNMPVVFELAGKVEHNRLKIAFQQVVDHFEIFRTTFEMKKGQLVQSISRQVLVDLPFEIAGEDRLEAIFSSWGQEPFTVHQAPLIRLKLVENPAGRQYLLLDSHHIIMDGLSYEPFFSALARAYEGEALENQPLEYKDYAVWQQSEEQQEKQAAHREYWLEMYQDGVPVLEWSTDFPAPASRTFAGAVARMQLSEEVVAGIRQLSAQAGATPFMILYSAFALLICKYSRQEEIVIGLTSSGRNHPQLENLIGMLANTLAVRTQIGQSQSFGEFLHATKQLLLESFDHDSYPFEELNQTLKKNGQNNPLFSIMFTMMQEGELPAPGGGALRPRETEGPGLSKFDLTFSGSESQEGINFEIEYATELFRRETIEKLLLRFEGILQQALSTPDMLLTDIDIVLEEEHRLLGSWNATSMHYPADQTIHGLFEAQAARTPKQVALYFKDKQTTYGELNRKANQLARTLRKMGVRPQEVVGIMAERSLEMMIGFFAILKAGGAYLPLEPSLPEGRLEFMLQDSASKVALVQEHLLDKIPASFQGYCLNLDDNASYAADGSTLQMVNEPTDLAYIIYTSGSTGQPKGVMIEHHAVLNRINWIQDHYPLGPGHVHLQKTPITFDVSVSELFWWSFYGASLAILEPGAHRYPDLIKKAVERYQVNIIHFVPSMLTAFIDYLGDLPDTRALKSLRQLYTSGEALAAHQVTALYHYMNEQPFRITNLYGPTEATIEVTWFDCKRGVDYRSIPIGQPIYNTEMYVLNPQGRVQPVNIPGELCIGGVQVARGYQNRDELNADRFVPNPFRAGEKMYRTGDLARWLPNGEIEFLGRMDHQVKIRGYRIELGEIEHALMGLESISDAVVIDRTDGAGNKYLCAYYLADEELPVNQARAHLAQSLPEYMIPARFVRMDSFPLTSSGKTDRKALPEPEGVVTTGTEFVPPATEVERRLADIWGAVLGLTPAHIGIRDNLFELGGDSIRSVQITSLISEAWNIDLNLKDIFECPTIEQLSSLIADGGKVACLQIPKAQSNSFYPASSAQKRIFLHQQMEGEASTLYNMPVAFEWEGRIDIPRLERAFQEVVAKHEALRTGFETRNGQLVQIIMEEASVRIEQENTTKILLAETIKNWVKPFELTRPPLIRLKVLTTKEGAQYLLMDTHHIIMDGMSYEPLFAALARAYEGDPLKAPALQYKDYAVWQQSEEQQEQQAAHREYWMEMYKAGVPVLELPTDFPAPASRTFAGDNLRFKLPKATVAGLRQLGAKTRTTPFMILYSAFTLLICRYAQQEEVVIGTVTSGRNHTQLKGILGMLVNTLAIRAKVEEKQTFNELLESGRQLLLESYSHDSYPYEELARSLKTGKNGNSLFDVVFTLIANSEWPALGEVPLKEVEVPGHEKAKFDLAFNGTDLGDEIVFDVTFSTELFRKATIQQLAHRFNQVLEQALENPERRVNEIDILLEEERQQLESWNRTEVLFPTDKTIHRLFEEQAAARPDHIALIFEGLELSYAELNEKANRLAGYLVKAGVQPETLVGICMERSPEMIISFLAVWKAGGAYVPLDPTYPVDRLGYMISDAQISIILTDEECRPIAKEASGEYPASILTMVSLEEELAQMPAVNPQTASGPENLAYVIYTSGSTGRPKGVLIEHRSVCNLVFAQRAVIPITSASTVLQFASTSFDASVLEIMMALCKGAALVVAKKQTLLPGPELTATLNRYRISHAVLSPTALGQLDPAQLPHLEWVVSGGEALPLSLARKWAASKKIVNEYGPTEATVATTASHITTKQEQIAIGRPLANYQVYILSPNGELLPPGLPGEIHIAGAGLARAYLNRPELTGEKFIPNPFGEEGSKMYRTGDLGRWLPDGEIEFLGRIDHQVKVRGFRIECGEIESALLAIPGIREVAVVDKVDSQGQKYLCAYYVSDKEPANSELRAFLAGKLPDFMIPSRFESMGRLPLTPNGKVDRKALKEQAIAFTVREKTTAPRNITELQLCRIWQAVLDVPEIGIFDNFFEWGGDSIKAIPLIDKIQEVFRVRIPVHAIFQNPTVELLARHLASVKAERSSRDSHLIPLQTNGRRPPLFFAPGIEGRCYYLYELAQAIGKEQPMYGFQSCGLQPGEDALESIEAIAGFNIGLMRAVQPTGPYYLAGHSLGGWVAYEMAHQLTDQGEEVAFLGLMDTYSPGLLARLGMLSPATKGQELNDLMLAVERLSAYYHVDVETDSLKEALGEIPADGHLDFIHQWAIELKLLPSSFSTQELWQWAHLMGSYSRIVYTPPTQALEIHLFRAMGQEQAINGIPGCLGWEEHTNGLVRKIAVPGTHTTMMKQPHANRLAEVLKQHIKAAEGKDGLKKRHRKQLDRQFLGPRSSD